MDDLMDIVIGGSVCIISVRSSIFAVIITYKFLIR